MEEIPAENSIRSRRRTIALEVTPAATVIVRAPLRAPAAYIEEIIQKKSSWILRKIDEVKRRLLSPGLEYAEGELFLFLGRSSPLHIVENGSMTIERSDRLYVSSTSFRISGASSNTGTGRKPARKSRPGACVSLSKRIMFRPRSVLPVHGGDGGRVPTREDFISAGG